MPKVKLKGLNIRRNSVGKWYVSLRSTGQLLLSAKCERDELDRIMAEPKFLHAYATAERKRRKVHEAGTIGALVERYKLSRRWQNLAERTQSDYDKVLLYLDPIFDDNAGEYETADVVEARDAAATAKGDKFSDFVLAVLSAVFSEAVESGLLKTNPALGVRRLYKADADANRRWSGKEWETAYSLAPAHLRAVLAIAKGCGLRGQDIAVLTWENYCDDPDMGKVLAFVPRKNGDKVGEITIGVPADLRALLDQMKAGDGVVQPASNAPICRNSLGRKYPSENAMRKAWQDFKASQPFKAALPSSSDLTLHGLRVTFSSELREQGFSDREVADMLGDLSEGMGKRYSRGAEMRKTSVRVHKKRVQNAS
ncbi:site-specific integrase [Devosia submarina]|uniref:site-specific integrase n=1 Tax=Devosia submarina TaxID=1173082 RepID=UPI0013004A35|nr:tyrosine-type recombinase/integrase [Devosia submarina]